MMRKDDTKKKIELGGLMVKAGFGPMHPKDAYILYGMLLDCQNAITKKPEIRDRWATLGHDLLTGRHKETNTEK